MRDGAAREIVAALGGEREVGAVGRAGIGDLRDADRDDAVYIVVDVAGAGDEVGPERPAEIGGIGTQGEFVLLEAAAGGDGIKGSGSIGSSYAVMPKRTPSIPVIGGDTGSCPSVPSKVCRSVKSPAGVIWKS